MAILREKWVKEWTEYVEGLRKMAYIPNSTDALRIITIVDELLDIIDRNKEISKGV